MDRIDSYNGVLGLIETLVKTGQLTGGHNIIKELDDQFKVGPLFEKDCNFRMIVSDPDAWVADIGMSNKRVIELVQSKDHRGRIQFSIQSTTYGSIAITFVFEPSENQFMFDVYEHVPCDPSLKRACYLPTEPV